MSGKFMSIKRIIIPTITMVIIASQLMGCAAANQNELLQMLQQGEAIEIEVAVPLSEVEGTAESIIWEQLALLETNETLRGSWDDQLGITVTDTGKNGMLYVDAEGNNVNNNTLRMALHNREFAKLFEDENSMLELSAGAQNQYTDIEADETDKALYMGVNGYFNLLPDATPNYSNPDSTLNRLEFMSMVMRAETPVSDIEADSAFATAVGNNNLNLYAQEVAESSYLDIASKSLNNMTANGTITRGEAVYLLMSCYFADELANVDISKASLSDAKDGGDFIEKAQSMSKEDITSKDYLKSYVLTYVITNPDEGVPTDMFKALVLAESKGIITDETRFDEGITKAEAVEMLVETLMQETGIPVFNFKQGKVEGYSAESAVGTEGYASEMDIEVTKSTPAPEDITMDSSVEDMIAAYPGEMTDTQKADLDEAKDYYDSGILTTKMYKETVYITLYGPTAAEREARLQAILQEGSKDSYIPATEEAKQQYTTGQGAPKKVWDPNFQGSDRFQGVTLY